MNNGKKNLLLEITVKIYLECITWRLNDSSKHFNLYILYSKNSDMRFPSKPIRIVSSISGIP